MISTSAAKVVHGSAVKAGIPISGPEYEALLIDLERRHEEALAMLADLEARIGQALRTWSAGGQRAAEGRSAAQ